MASFRGFVRTFSRRPRQVLLAVKPPHHSRTPSEGGSPSRHAASGQAAQRRLRSTRANVQLSNATIKPPDLPFALGVPANALHLPLRRHCSLPALVRTSRTVPSSLLRRCHASAQPLRVPGSKGHYGLCTCSTSSRQPLHNTPPSEKHSEVATQAAPVPAVYSYIEYVYVCVYK